MPDELDIKLKQIADMFGVTDTGNLRNIVESFAPGISSQLSSSPSPAYTSEDQPGESTPVLNTAPSQARSSGGVLGNNLGDLGLLTKANEMLGMFNNVKDSRITLLNSISPFLGVARQQRLTSAVQLLKVVSIISVIAPGLNPSSRNRG